MSRPSTIDADIIRLLHVEGRVTVWDVACLLDRPYSTASWALRRLCQRGKIKKIGKVSAAYVWGLV